MNAYLKGYDNPGMFVMLRFNSYILISGASVRVIISCPMLKGKVDGLGGAPTCLKAGN